MKEETCNYINKIVSLITKHKGKFEKIVNKGLLKCMNDITYKKCTNRTLLMIVREII